MAITIVILFLCKCRPSTGVQLPILDLLQTDSLTHFNTAKIPEGRPIVLLYFNPDCIHCQKETEGIVKYMDSLKKIRFYFISGDTFDRIKVFNKMYKLHNYTNVTILKDYSYSFPGKFKDVAPPYMVICDEYKRIRGVFPGEANIKDLIAFVNKI